MSYAPVPNAAPPHHPNNTPGLYTPQPMIGDSKEDIELKDVSMPHAHYSDHSHSTHAYVPDHKTSAVHLTREHQSRQNTPRGRLRGIVRKIWLTLFMPAVAFVYVAFCYAAATRVVPVRIWKVDEPSHHLSAIKAGVTTINIIIIGLALLPVKSLIDELKGEEFFRMIRISRSGVPLKAVNNVSTPSHTYGRGLISISQNHASKYYTGAILTGLMATIISSLAPAALSVGVIPVDKDLAALRVGAVASDSIMRANLEGVAVNPRFYRRAAEAASMGWAQGVLGVSMSFQATSPKYGVPVPLDLQATDRARYLTDVAIMDPVCAWTVPDPPLIPPANASNSSAEVTISLPDYGVTAQLRPYYLQYQSSSSRISLRVFSEDSMTPLVNISNGDPPITGVMGWLMMKCTSCKTTVLSDNVTIDMSQIPTQEYQGAYVSGNVTEAQTSELSILMCNPRLTVETREVRLDGSGKIEVMERTGLARQGNLHLAQTRLLVGKGLTKFSTDSGPDTMFQGIGQATQIQMFFGSVENTTLTPVLTPRSVDDLTQAYMIAQQAAMRSYLSGRMASSFVPGRMQEMTLAWVRLPVHGPPRVKDMDPHIHSADVALGTPPQNTSFALDVASPIQFALTPDCIYCPPDGMYDTSASSTLVKDPSLGAFGDGSFGGTRGYESITLGGLLQDSRSIMAFVDQMSPKFQLRFAGGHLGLFVPQSNETRREQNVIYRMNEQGQLLNPVWGLRLSGEDPQLTIGALDPQDYEGEINWVPLVNDSSKIQIDALKGYNGNAFPLPSPITAWIDTLSKNIYVPDLAMYMMNDTLIGPNQFINIYPPANETFGVRCNGTEHPSVEFSVEINGVDYPVNQTDLIRPTSGRSAPGYCNVGVMKSSLASEYTLGITFLRSVYLLPTGNCPGYYGFAVPKGGPTPTTTRKPRTTPTDAATCLSFVTPSSTPSPTIAVTNDLQSPGADEQAYAIHGRPDDQWVALRGAKDLPVLKVSGGRSMLLD